MNDFLTPTGARSTEYRNRPKRKAAIRSRPDRFALFAVGMAVVAMIAGVASADASSTGGVGTGGGGASSDDPSSPAQPGDRYARAWQRASTADKRWARKTSRCESGGDPRAVGGGGKYRGAFQFLRRTWRAAPKSPGGDPISFSWRTQAVVALSLKRQEGAGPWPVCGKASTRP